MIKRMIKGHSMLNRMRGKQRQGVEWPVERSTWRKARIYLIG